MTVGEEVGGEGVGASGLDPSLVTGTTLLNLDSEEDGKLTVGSASSTDTSIRVDRPREPCEAGAVTLAVSVSGGLGGHPASTSRAATPTRSRRRYARSARCWPSLPSGSSRWTAESWNAIPRDAVAICSLAPEREAAFRAALETAAATIRDAYAKTDPGVAITVTTSKDAAEAWTEDATADLLDLVTVVPSGPLAMSPDFQGLVETSTSVGEAVTEGTQLKLHNLTRSSNGAAAPQVIAMLDAAARLAGGFAHAGAGRPQMATRSRLARPRRRAARIRAALRPGSDRHRGSRMARDRRDR